MIASCYCIDQRGKGSFRIGHNRHGGAFDLVHFGGIDIDVDETRTRGTFAYLTCDAIIEAQPDTNDQVSLSDGAVDVRRAVHTGHADGERMGFTERAQPQQGSDYWNVC